MVLRVEVWWLVGPCADWYAGMLGFCKGNNLGGAGRGDVEWSPGLGAFGAHVRSCGI